MEEVYREGGMRLGGMREKGMQGERWARGVEGVDNSNFF